MKPYFDLSNATPEEIEAKHQEALNEMYTSGKGMLSPTKYSKMSSNFTFFGAIGGVAIGYLVCVALGLNEDTPWLAGAVLVAVSLAIWFGIIWLFGTLFVEDESLGDSIFRNYHGLSSFKHLKK